MSRILLILSFLLWPLPALALSGSGLEHGRSAMLFMHRQDWNNAALHAKQSGNATLAKLVQWQYLLDPDSQAGFEEITRFIDDNPDWPDQKKLRIRAELAIRDSHVADNDLIAWFGDNEPITGAGKLALAEADQRQEKGSQEKIAGLIRDAWRNGDFDETQEKHILDAHGSLLRREDDIARIDRLLWEEKLTAVKRVLGRLPADYQKLCKARMALIQDKRLAVIAVAEVPSSLKNDPGLIYDRMAYRARRDDDSGVRDMLLAAPAQVPYPEKWWRQRELQVRKAIGERKYTLAEKLLAHHAQIDGSELADAVWLDGWLHSEFMNRPKDGLEIFQRMYDTVHFPASKSRAAYWAGRAAEKAGDKEAAEHWYETAGAYSTTFYGQLAALRHAGEAPLHLPSPPSISEEARRSFEDSELARAAALCVELGEPELAQRLIGHMIADADDEAEAALAAGLGKKLGLTHLGVHGAKKALQRNVVLVDAGYPLPKTPTDLAVERPLALAVTRQESEFDAHARSPSGALGMMQLMPATGKEIARKHHLSFAKDRLFDPQYNIGLGGIYLARLINSYDGSYVMAIAAYNAGPGNVRDWTQQFGTPGNNVENAIDWIEKIPFSETRNYVQRVLENLQVYRHLNAGSNAPALQIGKDLVR
ncbi:MAG: lytic transglycosylase domain-containing protein [Pseudomonadota bacterium]|nr:lytic transglycosylase domain-containing protein [Pseudomonadota bacterium]